MTVYHGVVNNDLGAMMNPTTTNPATTNPATTHPATLVPPLADKVAIVTGGATGIGAAVARLLASQGARVAVVYSRSESEAASTVAAIEAAGGHASAIRADVSVPAQVNAAVRSVMHTYGRIDYLVNNAGITRQLPFHDLDAITDDMWEPLFAVNVRGAFCLSRDAAPFLRKQAGSAIVNVGSVAGVTGYGSSLPYAVSKAALHGLTRSLARALAPDIRVNCVAPGAVATRWWEGNERKMRELAGVLPLGRISTPEDIADTVLTLLTASSMTGQIVVTDNGQTL